MDLLIRNELNESDPAAIYDIVKDTGFFRSDELPLARDMATKTLYDPGSGYRFLIAEENGKTIGFACYGEISGTIGSYDLYWLGVYRSYQGRGTGKALLKKTEENVVKSGGRQLYISTSGMDLYIPTRFLYEKAGYTQVAVFKDYYVPGDDQIRYVKVF